MADKNTYIGYAQKYLQKGQLDRAIKEYYRALELDPRDVRTRHKIGELLARQGTRGEALKELGLVAEVHAKEGFYLKAVAVYKQMIKLKGDLYDVHLKLGGLYQQLSLLSEAMEHYRFVAEYYESNGTSKDCIEVYKKIVELSPDDIHSKLKLAEYCVREERNDEAISLYQSVAAELKDKNRFDDLIRVYERLIQLEPANLELQKALSKLYLEAQDPKRALARLQICFKADPGDTETLSYLGETFMSLDQVSKAKSVYKELARIYSYQGFPDKHRETYERIRRIDPSDADVLQVLGERGAAGPEVVHRVETSIPAPVTQPPPLHAGRTAATPAVTPSTQAASGHVAAVTAPVSEAPALAVSSDKLRDIPASVAKLMTETEVYLKYSLIEKATAHLKTILEREPDCYVARERLREMLAGQGRLKEAAAESSRMSQLASAVGDNLQARLDLERASQLDPENDQYRYALLALKQLIARQAGAHVAPPFLQASTAAHVLIEEEDEELVDDQGLHSLPPGSNLLEEHELVDDSDAAPSVYLTLSALDVMMEPIEPEAKEAGGTGRGGETAGAVAGRVASASKATAPASSVGGERVPEPVNMVTPGAPTAFAGGVPVFELEEMVEDGEGLDLIRELELELGIESTAAKPAPDADRPGRVLELATAYYQMQLFDDAVRELELHLQEGSASVEAQWLLGRCRFGRGDVDVAVRWYKTVLNRTDLTETQELEVLFDLGRAYETQGELQLALDLYEEISSINDQFRDEEVQARILDVSSRLSPGGTGTAQTLR